MMSKVSVPLAFHFTAPSSPPSDCWRLRFSLRVDIVRLINSHIIIIIIIINRRQAYQYYSYRAPNILICVYFFKIYNVTVTDSG